MKTFALPTAFALLLATKAHEKQFRKIEKCEYIEHPIRVAEMVRTMGGDSEQVAAALLHDVLEDTPIRLHHLKMFFSPRVVSLVDAVSRRRGEEEQAYFSRILANPDAILIKIADSLDNYPTASAKARVRYERFFGMVFRGILRDSFSFFHFIEKRKPQ